MKTTPDSISNQALSLIFGGDPDLVLINGLREHFENEITVTKHKPFMEAMKELGFTNFQQLQEHEKKSTELGYEKQTLLQHLHYRIKYPLCRPFTDKMRDQICEKHDLVIGNPKDYIGPIPLWAMKQVIATSISNDDTAFLYADPKLNQIGKRVDVGYPVLKNNTQKNYAKIRRRQLVDFQKNGFFQTGVGKVKPAGLMIMAPLAAFDTSMKKVIDNHLVSVTTTDIRYNINGMTFQETIQFFTKNPRIFDGGTAQDAAIENFDIHSAVRGMSTFDEVIQYVKESGYADAVKSNPPEACALTVCSPTMIRNRFKNIETLVSYLKSNPELVPEGVDVDRHVWRIWDPVIFLPVKQGNLSFVAFGGDEAYDYNLYTGTN